MPFQAKDNSKFIDSISVPGDEKGSKKHSKGKKKHSKHSAKSTKKTSSRGRKRS
jgi:hypothetical protein